MKDISNLMFIPRNVEKGEILFYAAQSKNKKRGTDIYMVKTGNGHKYTEPVAVDAVNTEYDEIMPYYDPIGKDLFFASMGHNSMGGFDLFKAHYDAERNSWTDPVNLSFPVNSPSNEYLMIPGTDLGSIMLITDRQGADSMCTAFLLHIKEPRKQMAKADPVALKRIGNFGGLEGRPEMTDITTKNILPETRPVPKNTSTVAPVKQAEPQKESLKMPADYNASLRLALDNQYKADSLSRLAQDARIQVKSIADPDERWVIQKDIISWEKQSSEYQAKADEYYLAVKKMEKENPGAKKIPGTIEKDTVINDITVYKFKQPAAVENKPKVPEQEPVVSKPEPQKLLEGEPGEVVKPAKETRSEMVRFAILDKSPYSSNNPFPEEVNYPKGAYYKIQLAAVSKDPEWDTFGGLSPVTAEPVTGKPMKRYYAGKFSTYESARTALEDVRRKGFPDAFVVGWYDGQKLTVSKVMDLEKK